MLNLSKDWKRERKKKTAELSSPQRDHKKIHSELRGNRVWSQFGKKRSRN